MATPHHLCCRQQVKPRERLPDSVYAADLDGDGDQDVLSASLNDHKIAWYENTDGLGTFGHQQVLTKSAYSASSVYATDLDGDGDQDVLSALRGSDEIIWFENTDGFGTFGPQKVITMIANAAVSVYSADLDGDGDTDVLSASQGDDKIAWYENLLYDCNHDGQPCDFGAGQDGNLCNSACSGNKCILEVPICDDGLYCNGVDACDATLGCLSSTAPDCNDGVACTDDSCDEENDKCVNATNDDSCDDGLYCNGVETCDAALGCQAGTAPACDDGVACTDDGCDETNDRCTHTTNDGACDDGLYCNGAETCDISLGCQVGTASCTANECDEVADTCIVVICGDGRVQQDEECDDGNQSSGDGCSADCAVEDGWLCDIAEPSQCTAEEGKTGGCGCDAADSAAGDWWLMMMCALSFWLVLDRRRQPSM